jgi:L-ascorbate metabolism protein UlaG (beta-lactamase superfamily)
VTIDVTWLGHSTVVLDVDGTRLLTDPLLRRHAGLLRRRGEPPAPAVWQNVDGVLLSHLHHDHADLRSLELLPEGTPVVTAAPNIGWLRRHRLAASAPSRGQWVRVGDSPTVAVRLCPAVHRARPMPHRPNGVTGHIVRSGVGAVWCAGDTSLFAEMSRIPEWAGAHVELALVPIGGWGPRLSEGHMGPEEAAEACALVGARNAVPVHWGTLHTPGGRNLPRGWMDRPGPEFASALARRAPDCRLLRLGVGGRRRVPDDAEAT